MHTVSNRIHLKAVGPLRADICFAALHKSQDEMLIVGSACVVCADPLADEMLLLHTVAEGMQVAFVA